MAASNTAVRPQDADYEALRSDQRNSRLPNAKPAEIYTPSTTEEVATIMKRAHTLNLKVGVRSGGHKFGSESLIDGGILISTKNLNKRLDYDEFTTELAFSPGHTVEEISALLRPVKRFFPHGHNRTVGLGGFILGGGQGYFLRGWGYTADSWVTQFEAVTAAGEIVIANRYQNMDLFWAAPGSGLGFFAVITRIWGRTVPAARLFKQTWVFDATDSYQEIAKWAVKMSQRVPRFGNEVVLATQYADKDEPQGDDNSKSKRILLAVSHEILADRSAEAETLARPFSETPAAFEKFLVFHQPLAEQDWEQSLIEQDKYVPTGDDLRWVVDSILTDPELDDEELIDRSVAAMVDLPSRHSMGTLVLCDSYPNGKTSALSIPAKWSLTTLAAYKDPAHDEKIRDHVVGIYKDLEDISSGQYVVDFDATQRVTKVMSDDALERWLQIRVKWDPQELFIGHRGFAQGAVHQRKVVVEANQSERQSSSSKL